MHLEKIGNVLRNIFGDVRNEPCIAFPTTCFVRGGRRDEHYFLIEIEVCGSTVSIHDIVVNTENCGIGSSIVQTICSYCAQNNLRIETRDTLPSHAGFWLKNGFVPTRDCAKTYTPKKHFCILPPVKMTAY